MTEFAGVVSVLVGILTILGAFFKWGWFMSLTKVKWSFEDKGDSATAYWYFIGLLEVAVGGYLLLNG